MAELGATGPEASPFSCTLSWGTCCVQEAKQSGGKVLVHCSQGVSRSAALAIAFLMWQGKRPYEQVFAEVKAIRGIANPNIGFTCQARSPSVAPATCAPPKALHSSVRTAERA